MAMRRWRVCLGAVLGLLVLLSCGSNETAETPATPATSTPTQQATAPAADAPRVVEVTLSFVMPRFRPDPIVVQVGKPVQFRLTSTDTRHNVIIESLGINVEVPQKALNQSVTTKVVTPQKVGTFPLFCGIHRRLPMEGTLEVTETSPTAN